jgi:preprotein translocase subunit YajC
MFIKEAFAQTANAAAQATEPTLMSFLPIIGIVVIFYLLLIRPQTKRAKEQKQMQNELRRGDEIVISGGELGRVMSVSDNYVTMEIATEVEIVVLKSAVQTLLPKGTLKSVGTAKGNRTLKNNKHKSNESRHTDEDKETEANQPETVQQDEGKNQ